MELHNEASLSSGLNSEKAMYHPYMISRAFIPPWSLVMRDRKLSDQTLPYELGSRNPSFTFWHYFTTLPHQSQSHPLPMTVFGRIGRRQQVAFRQMLSEGDTQFSNPCDCSTRLKMYRGAGFVTLPISIRTNSHPPWPYALSSSSNLVLLSWDGNCTTRY